MAVGVGVDVSDGVRLGNSGVMVGGRVLVAVGVGVEVLVGRGVKLGGKLAVAVAVAVGVWVGVSVGSSPIKVGSGVMSGGGGGRKISATAKVMIPNAARKMMRVMALKNPLRRTMGKSCLANLGDFSRR